MLLNVDPFNQGSQYLNVPIKPMGEVVQAVGQPHFVHRLTLFLNDLVPLDFVHVERSRLDSRSPLGYRCEWLGSGAVNEAQSVVDDVMALYYERFQAADPLFAGIRTTVGTHLVVRDMSQVPAGEFRERIFESREIAHECVLTKSAPRTQCSLAIVRRDRLPPFSLADLNYLRHLGELLFPLVELHASTAAIKRTANAVTDTDPLVLFDARIERDGIRLSKREYETCRHLIRGHTVPEIAELLGVLQTSAKSYVQRAFAKLGVRTRRELAQWALGQTAQNEGHAGPR
ncbi:response regulator transcription factor [Paraburkholderia sacchari]|uniref:response regulator transcription factor n=1 Tax=Paraburkholderia sacchari TaxID=159450 RepID=UPI0005434312|nr:helix-turn-helix transcriptional regulator [Paraburkholderia sacchari]NLP63158.1 helix-turn-helix transcriptional regulator [Paraburkholderia sacchari]